MRLLAFAAASEATLALALLLDPSIVLQLLLGTEASGAALVMGRFASIALLGLSLACWPSGDVHDQRPLLRAMLTYNALAGLYLGQLGIVGKWVGPLLWPAAVLHVVLAVWCFVATRQRATGHPGRKIAAEVGR